MYIGAPAVSERARLPSRDSLRSASLSLGPDLGKRRAGFSEVAAGTAASRNVAGQQGFRGCLAGFGGCRRFASAQVRALPDWSSPTPLSARGRWKRRWEDDGGGRPIRSRLLETRTVVAYANPLGPRPPFVPGPGGGICACTIPTNVMNERLLCWEGPTEAVVFRRLTLVSCAKLPRVAMSF